MKTIAKILIALSALTISFTAHAKGGENSVSALAITYKVIVHMPAATPSVLRGVFVVITDETGRLVAPAQLLISGKTEYKFAESGPVKGIRVAKLSNGLRPHADSWISNEDMKAGLFQNGASYLFNLYISLPVPDKANID
ncbi:MAG: hypothetical protein NTU98_01370 [Bacteroidetes bacterium]|nr:hypothetical protein [Bacteroidota bacterium]